jgi:Fe-S oxidoreductase
MCPSFRATREEEHSTRGRAHLLWEMTKGEVIKDGWQSEEVKESLDLCLACKGCKSDCPVGVDVATYKAEFLSHYYEGKTRPLNHYAFGNIDFWARLASAAPGLVNITTQLPLISDIAKLIAGIPQQRSIPAFAPQTFKSWFRRRVARNQGGPAVVLWPDTFNNYFLPHTAQAAVEVLEHSGFEVLLPEGNLCCGRPLYDFGLLDRAESLLLQILDTLTPEIEAGIPIVGLEPSCVAVFRDELCNLFPRDDRAQRLSRQVFLLSEFLENHKDFVRLPQLERKAIMHGHCHHKAIMKMSAEESVLRRVGVDFQSPAPGCCGMAGSFGFEADRFDVSMDIGELELLPAVRKAPPDWLVIANGFSCREQIAQGTDRHALHLAEILQMAIHQGPAGPPGSYPETPIVRRRDAAIRQSMKKSAIAAVGLAAGAALLWSLAKRRS